MSVVAEGVAHLILLNPQVDDVKLAVGGELPFPENHCIGNLGGKRNLYRTAAAKDRSFLALLVVVGA